MNEIWKDISEYEGLYQVSSYGRVKSIGRIVPHKIFGSFKVREKVIKQANTDNGYCYVSLWKNNIGDGFLVHRLVATAFIDNPDNKDFVNHIDGAKNNNSINNLEWCTKSENAIHAFDIGLNKKRFYGDGPKAKKVINSVTGEITTSIRELAENTGLSYYSLRGQLTGRQINRTIYKILDS